MLLEGDEPKIKIPADSVSGGLLLLQKQCPLFILR